MKFNPIVLAAAATLACAGSAQAVVYTFTGDTTGGPTYNRPLSGKPPTDLSLVGTDVAYSSFSFTVDTDGFYLFRSFADGWDNFLTLYKTSFDPADALANALVANDDAGNGIGTSGFFYALDAGTTYVLVTTGFDLDDYGSFENRIRGRGTVSVVPEPASYALLAFGLAGLALWKRGGLRARHHS